MRYAVILAGGWGERLWPMSTRDRPKQLLKLAGDSSLVSRTLERVAPLVNVEESLALTSATLHRQMLAELKSLPQERVIGEPVGRNTAPAIALAAHLLIARDPDAVLVVLPADHVIGDDAAFREAIEVAADAAERERALVTLGIPPDRAETEYGYIKAGEPAAIRGVLRVEMFTEKPDIETAESFLADGRYFWNSGMFIWRADRFLDEVGRQLPEIGVALSDVRSTPRDAAFTHELEAYYGSVPSISVDYGVMEGAGEVLVVPTRFSWDDVGAWSALGRVWTSNARGNSVRGDSLLIDSHGCVVYSEGGVVAVVGLSDVVVAHTPGATLVCPKERARDVRRVVEELKRRGSIEDAES